MKELSIKERSAIPARKDGAEPDRGSTGPAAPSAESAPPARGHERTEHAQPESEVETAGRWAGNDPKPPAVAAEPSPQADSPISLARRRARARVLAQARALARGRARDDVHALVREPARSAGSAEPSVSQEDEDGPAATRVSPPKAFAQRAASLAAPGETAEGVSRADLPAPFQRATTVEDLSEKPASARRRKFVLVLSAVIGILLPSLLAVAYYGFIASDQFITEVRFLVKSGGPVTPDLLGQLTGTGSSISTFLDAQIVMDYLRSRQIIEDLEPEIDLREIFSRPSADLIARLPADASIEDLTEYWQSMVEASTEMMSGIVSVSVRTFRSEDSERLSGAILRASERLVNQLSARARADAVRFATEDLQSAEERLRLWRNRVYQLREKEQTLDAAGTAEAHTQLVGNLEAELAKSRSELQYRQALISDNSPSVMSLKSRIASLSDEIERVRRQATTSASRGSAAAQRSTAPGGSRDALTTVLSGFEEAQAELDIAQEYYKSALRYLEESRAGADRQQSYVAVIVGANMAQESRYPQRLLFIVFAVVVSGIVWGLTMLMVFSVRDHLM